MSMSIPQERRQATVARVVAFFEANPDEELQLKDMQQKFGISYRAAQMAAVRLRDRGDFESLTVLRKVQRPASASPAELRRRLHALGEQLHWIRVAAGNLPGGGGGGIADMAAEAQAHVQRLREVLEGETGKREGGV